MDLHPPPVGTHDSLGDIEAQPGTLSGGLGGEKGFKDPRQELGRDPPAGVLDLHLDAASRWRERGPSRCTPKGPRPESGRLRPDGEACASVRSLEGVDQDGQERLTKLSLVAQKGGKPVVEIADDGDPLAP